MKKINLLTSAGITALLCAVTFTGTVFFMQHQFRKTESKFQRLQDLDNYIQKNFYTYPDETALMDSMLKGYVEGLNDRYSQYLTAEEYDALMTKESGRSVGIGVTVFQNEAGFPEIMEVQENSPAEEAGLANGDIIIAADAQNVSDIGYLEAINKIRGEEGTSVNLRIKRQDDSEQDFTIIRRTFDLVTVQSEMLENHIGYLKITSFRENTADQFDKKLNALLNQGADALIFDVRDNGGGLLSALEKMLDPLLPEGEIATAAYHGGVTETIMTSDSNELVMPMAVLVNGNSASAAELFSASLRDFRQAKLVGTQTFGKGVMQVTTRMPDGGGLTLTVATYQTSVSECYHGIGLTPDLIIEDTGDGTDPQLNAAIALFS